jgi:hypothetical protein
MSFRPRIVLSQQQKMITTISKMPFGSRIHLTRLLGVICMIFLWENAVLAQAKAPKTAREITESANPSPKDSIFVLYGHLVQSQSGAALNGAIIANLAPMSFVATLTSADNNGDFALRFHKPGLSDTLALDVYWLGDVHPVFVSIDRLKPSARVTLALEMVPTDDGIALNSMMQNQSNSYRPKKQRK